MSDQPRSGGDLFAGLKEPDPPGELRDRVLRSTRRALAASPRPDRWTRIWESRTFRAAWGLSVLALVVCNLALPARDRATIGGSGSSVSLMTRGAGAELADVTSLPRLDMDAAPRGLSGPATSEGKEDAS